MKIKVASIVVALALAALLVSGSGTRRTTVYAPSVGTSSPPSVSIGTTPHLIQSLPIHTVGEITRHAGNYLNKDVRIEGYLLKKGRGYNIFSDEMAGSVTRHDLSITGAEITRMRVKQKYILEGTFVADTSSNTSRTLYALHVSKISWQN